MASCSESSAGAVARQIVAPQPTIQDGFLRYPDDLLDCYGSPGAQSERIIKKRGIERPRTTKIKEYTEEE